MPLSPGQQQPLSKGAGEAGPGAGVVLSELNLAGREGLILHDDRAAASQDQDVQVPLLLVGLLVPLTGHLCVMGWDQGHLGGRQDMPDVRTCREGK